MIKLFTSERIPFWTILGFVIGIGIIFGSIFIDKRITLAIMTCIVFGLIIKVLVDAWNGKIDITL